ncbi:hypothetical protein D6D01_06560 [Aureobasidium pullulans]|uniref:Fumarylacetoacetase-like C-terminal domain-containing protein n=1 Tax=Aureobasidium pullulans TaxID=5580 RepID=A0A4S9L0E9_AURPU|nr:hypothetical protein D6D01_06560 [Aureobasidium pullulans]
MANETQPLVKWERFVRFVSVDGSIKYGEPILSNADSDIHQLALDGKLEVTVLEGADVLSTLPTDRKEAVKTLLGPLTPKDVPVSDGLSKPGTTIADTNEAIPIPQIAQSQCDYEGELCILIGKDAKNVSEEDALKYVAAYTVGNDVSARDWQREPGKAGPVPQWSFSKSFDKYAPLGPALVSTSVLGAAEKQTLKTFVNGELRQSGDTSDLCFGVKALVAFCSQGQTLQAGSLIMTGTPGGVGLFMKPQGFLQDGDEVIVEIGGIGKVVNRMKFE